MEGKRTLEGLRTGRIHNIRRSNKSQHPIPVAFYATLVLPGYPEERGGGGGGAWRCVGESKKRKKGECCDSYCSRRHVIYSWNVAAHTCLCIYVISDIFRFICSPKNLMEFSYLWSEYFEKCILCDYVLDEA